MSSIPIPFTSRSAFFFFFFFLGRVGFEVSVRCDGFYERGDTVETQTHTHTHTQTLCSDVCVIASAHIRKHFYARTKKAH